MFMIRFFFHILEFLTLDLIPSYFRRYLMFNADNSGVFNDSRKMVSKTQEMVFYPKDPDMDTQIFKENINQENYYRNLNSSIFAHILTVLILMLFSPMLMFAIILYPFIAAAIKFVSAVIHFVYIIASHKFEASDDRLLLTVDGGLGKYSSSLDRKNAAPYLDFVKSLDGMTQVQRKQRNSDFIKERQTS